MEVGMFKVPSKYESAVRSVYTDEDGIWCILNENWVHGTDENQVIHCETFDELRRELTDIREIKNYEKD